MQRGTAPDYGQPGQCPTRPRASCYSPGGSPGVYMPSGNTVITETDKNGSERPYGASPKNGRGEKCTIGDMATDMCILEERLSVAAVAAAATTVLQIQLRWWWQINWWVNVGDQAAETFALTNITYGNDVPYFQTTRAFEGSTIDGAPYGAPNGIDIRRWNIGSFGGNFYPTPANGWEDPTTYFFTNNAGAPQDLQLEVAGPAVLQI